MTKKSESILPKNAYIHVDMISVSGPCKHLPIGQIKYSFDEDRGYIPVLAFGDNKPLRAGSKETIFVASKDLTDDGYAHKLEMRFCPPKQFQKHNVFGHSWILDYAYHAFDHFTRLHGIEVADHDRDQWRQGFVWFTEVHLTGNFGCPRQYVELVINAIDENNAVGKQRPLMTSISLGFHGKRRSRHCVATIYNKYAELLAAWKTLGPFKRLLLEAVVDSIRGEIKLYDKGLKALNLQYGANWKNVNVAELFFAELNKFEIRHAIQPLLTPEQSEALTKAEKNAYSLWQNGTPLCDQFKSRTTAWKYAKAIVEKTGIVVTGDRKPEALPAIDLKTIFCPENVLPIPDALFGTEFYRSPGKPDLPPISSGSSHDCDPDGDKAIWVNGHLLII